MNPLSLIRRSFYFSWRNVIASVIIIIGFCSATCLAGTLLPPGFAEAKVADNLDHPTAMAIAPDGRVFVCEQKGQLRVLKNDTLLASPFLTVITDNSGERGLLGVTFDPNFATNNYIYIYYTATTPTLHNRVSRFTASGDVAVPNSELVILDIDDLTTYNQHNAGAIHFGKDGKLYVAVGDNQNPANPQSLATLKGKILRINSDGTIPTDNPFYTTATGKYRAIWALGFRNPFTFDVQPGTGRIFVNDTGQDGWEEINDLIPGGNYGWPQTEGYTSDPLYRSPVYAFPHGNSGCDAITGGAFYNPSNAQFPSEYVGKYFFMDLCNAWIQMYDPVANTVSPFATATTTYIEALTFAPDGSLYYLSYLEPGLVTGSVYKIQYTASLAPSIGTQPQSQIVSLGYAGTFTINASGYAPLSYQWTKSGANISGATSPSYTTPPVTTNDNGAQYLCTVTNAYGVATSNSAILSVTSDQPPISVITLPNAGTYFNAGDTISYSGTGTDLEDGSLPASAFTWRVDLAHETHLHPFIPATNGVMGGSFTIPTGGEASPNIYYRIYLTVADSRGLTQTTFRDIFPNLSTFQLATSPPGLLVSLDGNPVITPATVTGVVNFSNTLGIYSPQTLNGVVYSFSGWSDGGAATHDFFTPATSATYTASFVNARQGTISLSPNPIQPSNGGVTGSTTVTWSSSGVTAVEIHVNAPDGALFSTNSWGSSTTGDWVGEGTTFFLQDRSGGAPLNASNTLASVTAHIAFSGGTPVGSISATPNPIPVPAGSGVGTTNIIWTASGVSLVDVRVGSPTGSLFASRGPGTFMLPTGNWVGDGTTFYLQDRTNGALLDSSHTLGTVTVRLSTASGPSGTIVASPNPIPVTDASGYGATTVSWTTANVATVQVRVDSPNGPLFASSGSGTFSLMTENWVGEGTTFYLQNVSNGLPLSAANTLASIQVHLTTAGTPRTGFISANPNPIQVLDGSGVGATAISFTSSGVSTVEVHLNSPTGPLFARRDAGSFTLPTGNWVYNGMTFYLQDVSGGLPLTSNNTLATTSVVVLNDHPPVANNRSLSTNEDVAIAFTVTALDSDAQPLTYSIVTSPTHGTLSGTAPNLTYAPAANYNGPDSFAFKANDGLVDSNVATVSITVNPVNDAPVATNQSVATNEDTSRSLILTSTDIDSPTLTFSVVTGPTNGTLSGSAPNLTYTPSANYNGPDSFTFKANDGLADSNVATVSITVNPVNDPPLAANQSVSTNEDTSRSVTLTASDVDSPTLTFSVVTGPTKGTLSGSAPNLTYTPSANYNGADSFTFRANDGLLNSNAATVSITVTPVNDSPIARNDTATMVRNTSAAIQVLANDSDVDGDSVTVISVTQGARGTVGIATGGSAINYTPRKDYTGTDTFNYTISDGRGGNASATVTVTVTRK